MKKSKLQRLLHSLKWQQTEAPTGNPVYDDSLVQNRLKSAHSTPLIANAKTLAHLDKRSKSSLKLSQQFIHESEQKYYLCDYQYEGETWCIEIVAKSFEDAQARLKRIAYGVIAGEVKASIPVRLGLLAKLWKVFTSILRP